MHARAIILLGLAGALALGGEGLAQTRRQPYDVPNLAPNYDPYEMKRDEPWLPKKANPYAIKEPPAPYSTPQSRSRVEKAVRDYNPGGVYAGSASPAEPSQPTRSGRRGISGPCNYLFETCR